MPEPTTQAIHDHAVATRRTSITKRLEDIFNNPNLTRRPHWQDFSRAGHLTSPAGLDQGCKRVLGLTQELSDHLSHWPNALKSAVHQKLVRNARRASPRRVRFYWELQRNISDEETPIQDPDPAGEITITFRSPLRRFRRIGADNVHVDVGTSDPH